MNELPSMTDVLAHRPPMILLDEMIAWEEEGATCRVEIRPDSPFVEEGAVPALVAIEYMAQSVAAFAGVQPWRHGEPIEVGFLIGCREMAVERESFPVGTVLAVRVQRKWGDAALGHFTCEVREGDALVASAQLTVYRGPMKGVDEP